MDLKRFAVIGTALVVVGGAFWAGSEIQKTVYQDQCLDLGGGRNPGNHPICVVERAAAPLQLGPVVIAAQDVVGGETRKEADDRAIVELGLAPEIAAALSAYTKASVGGSLDIRVGGNLVRSVNIVEGVEGDRFILALTKADADLLARSFGLAGH